MVEVCLGGNQHLLKQLQFKLNYFKNMSVALYYTSSMVKIEVAKASKIRNASDSLNKAILLFGLFKDSEYWIDTGISESKIFTISLEISIKTFLLI